MGEVRGVVGHQWIASQRRVPRCEVSQPHLPFIPRDAQVVFQNAHSRDFEIAQDGFGYAGNVMPRNVIYKISRAVESNAHHVLSWNV